MREKANIVKLLIQLSIITLPFFIFRFYKLESTVPRKFPYPIIYNSDNLDSIPTWEFTPKFIMPGDQVLIGKYGFGDSIDLKPDWNYNEIETFQGFPSEQNYDVHGFKIIVDYYNTLEYSPYLSRKDEFYPVFIVNPSDSVKYFYSGFSPDAIQEAFDTNGVWRPIEYNKHWSKTNQPRLKVQPNEFILFLFPKYKGTYRTRLRIRFKSKDNILVSRFFFGSINMDQFKVEGGTYLEYSINSNPEWASKHIFFGGNLPPNSEWENTTYKQE